MAARNVLLCFIFSIIAFPVCVDENTKVYKKEFVCGENITPIADFYGLQFQPNLQLVELLYKVFIHTMCAGLILFLCYQLRDIQRNECEKVRMFEMINRTNEKVTEVQQFCKETEDMFSNLEAKSKSLQYACDLRKETGLYLHQIQPLQAEVFKLKEMLQRQQDVFARYSIDLGGSKHTCDSVTAELTVASAFVGSQVRRIESDIAEDALTLKNVQRETRILRVYFGK